ncbi:suppressor of fused domain protein [Phytohabitans kaempferiae]|uniref:Suppressor of fused domain protein n=1 Tax=Phytohabitans kaempferiae TaxID=1620943 RepID=A0ABV6M3H3_9ACTN
MNLIEHMEQTLGPIGGGWSETLDGRPVAANVVRFLGTPFADLVTFTTLGLSKVVLKLSNGRSVRMELLLSCRERDSSMPIPGVLVTVAGDLISSRVGPDRGTVLGPAGPLLPDSHLTALYCSVPVFHRKEFRTYSGTDPATVFVQLIPISDDEVSMVDKSGWSVFEDHLERADVDVFDLSRPSSLV